MPLRTIIIGPIEKPVRTVTANVIRESDTPGFFIVQTDDGAYMTVPSANIRDIKLKLNGESK